METSGAAEPLLGGRRGPGCAQTSVPGLDRILSGRRSSAGRADASRQYVPLHTPDASKLQGRSRAHGNATGTPDRMRMAHRDWKLAERHHRHKLSLAYLGESEMSGPPFSVRYRQLSRRELTLEVLLSSYPAGRAALYADADGVPLPEPQLPSSTPLSPTLQPSPPRGSMPSTPALGAQAGQPSAPGHMSRLPSGLLLSRRVEQLVGGFIRTRDVRAIDPVFSRELADLGMLGSGMNGSASPQPSSPAQSLILVRCGAIIIRLFHLRAIVVHDGVYIVLDPRAPETSDADAVRAVALRLKASTQEDRLGPADEVAIRDGIRDPRDRSLCGRDVSADQSLAGQDLSERGDCSSRGRDDAQPPSPTLSERLGGSGLLVPTLPSREPSCVSDLSHQSNETDVEMPAAPSGAGARERAAAGPHAGSAAPVLIGCSRIGEASSAAELALSGGSGGGNGGGGDDGGCAGAADWRGMRPSGALSVSSSQPRQGAGATPRGAAGTAPGRGGGVGGGSASAGGAPAVEEAPGEAQRGAPRADGQPAQPQPQDSGGGVEESAAAQSLPPFPLRALESIFDVVVDDLKARLTALKDETRTALHALRLAVADTFGGIDDSVSFEIVRSLRERVRALTVSVRGAARAVAEVLDDDVQMAFIYLKKVHFAPECYEQDPNFRTQHEEVELLFESYLNALSSLQAALETVEYSIDSSERFVAQRLSSQRNGLLRLDVTFTVITAAISLCSFFTGIFGMNLASGLEELLEPIPFVTVFCVTLAIIIATTLLMVYAPQFVYSRHLIGQRRRLMIHAEDTNEQLPRLTSFRFNNGQDNFASLLASGKQ